MSKWIVLGLMMAVSLNSWSQSQIRRVRPRPQPVPLPSSNIRVNGTESFRNTALLTVSCQVGGTLVSTITFLTTRQQDDKTPPRTLPITPKACYTLLGSAANLINCNGVAIADFKAEFGQVTEVTSVTPTGERCR